MSSQRIILAFVAASTLVACGPKPAVSNRATPQPAPTAASRVDDAGPDTLGSLDGTPLTLADVDPEIRAELSDLENELEQRRMHLRWVGFENAVTDRLLEREAEKRNQTVDEMLEGVATGVEVSDDEVRAIYEENKEAIPVPFEDAQEMIRTQLVSSARERAARAFSEELRQSAKIDYRASIPELPRYEIDVTEQPSLGNGEAKVTIVEFSDFECPYCGRAREVLAELRKSYGEKVRVVYRDFPLRQHPNARAAAEAAHCAMEQGKFWEYHDVLFDNSEKLGDEVFTRFAKELELDLERFAACRESDRPAAAIATDESAAQRLGVEGTPAIFINGVKLIGLLPVPLLKSIIDHELGRS